MFNLNEIDPSWQPIVTKALSAVDSEYLAALANNKIWLPGPNNIFNAFKLPLEQTNYILFGESPYPREESANGFAFWDNAVKEIWSPTGLSKAVNRATSLRNFIKMLLVTSGQLASDATSQSDIAALDKAHLIDNLDALFSNLMDSGFLLLNASLVLSDASVRYDSKQWRPFIQALLNELKLIRPSIGLILLGNIAKEIVGLTMAPPFLSLVAEHPYNISFIKNQKVAAFFKRFNLLEKHGKLSPQK